MNSELCDLELEVVSGGMNKNLRNSATVNQLLGGFFPGGSRRTLPRTPDLSNQRVGTFGVNNKNTGMIRDRAR